MSEEQERALRHSAPSYYVRVDFGTLTVNINLNVQGLPSSTADQQKIDALTAKLAELTAALGKSSAKLDASVEENK